MKIITLIFLSLCLSILSLGQDSSLSLSADNFENQVLAYQPVRTKLSEKDFNYALMILNEIKSATDNDPLKFCVADYYNVLSCFLTLQESSENISVAYNKFKNAENSCEYFLHHGMFDSSKYEVIREEIESEIKKCSETETQNKAGIDLEKYAKIGSYDYDLIRLVSEIGLADALYRDNQVIDWEKQKILDQKNQNLIDSLYLANGKYIGKSMVGDTYSYVMWSVIQHSDQDMMKKYLPVVLNAVKNNELGEVPLKMLLDRYYGLAYGYQIFGSQKGFGFDLADEETREKIKREYNIK
ncbi:MAG: hypothetical protein AB8B53_07965 [Flavobacteriales bacterium]